MDSCSSVFYITCSKNCPTSSPLAVFPLFPASFFGRAFEKAAESTSSRTLHDHFDTSSKYYIQTLAFCMGVGCWQLLHQTPGGDLVFFGCSRITVAYRAAWHTFTIIRWDSLEFLQSNISDKQDETCQPFPRHPLRNIHIPNIEESLTDVHTVSSSLIVPYFLSSVVIELKTEDRSKFLDALITLLSWGETRASFKSFLVWVSSSLCSYFSHRS